MIFLKGHGQAHGVISFLGSVWRVIDENQNVHLNSFDWCSHLNDASFGPFSPSVPSSGRLASSSSCHASSCPRPSFSSSWSACHCHPSSSRTLPSWSRNRLSHDASFSPSSSSAYAHRRRCDP